MTNADLTSYLRTEAVAAGIAGTDIEKRVSGAIKFGSASFWGARNWYFKMREDTFSITSTQTTYNAPKDFGGLIDITHQDSSFGGSITYISKEEFDRRYPKPSQSGPGRPVWVTCYQSEGEWKLQFFPRPTVMDMNLVYEISKLFAVETVPDNFADGLLIACAKYIPRLDSRAGLVLEERKRLIYKELMLQNNVSKRPFNSLARLGPEEVRLPRFADQHAFVS